MRISAQDPMGPPGRSSESFTPVELEEAGTPFDFREVLIASNAEAAKKRVDKDASDLSKAGSYDEFLEAMNAKERLAQGPRNTLDKNDFLRLFVAQLQNQDPTKPQEGAEMAAQLASFNSLEQMLNVNKNLEAMAAKNEQAQALSYVHFLGKNISLGEGRLDVASGEILGQVNMHFMGPATQVQAELVDAKNNVVFSQNLGAQAAGEHPLTWQQLPRLADGTYQVRVQASDVTGSGVPVQLTSQVEVVGLDLQDMKKPLQTRFGALGLENVRAVVTKNEAPPEQKPMVQQQEVNRQGDQV